MAKRNFRDRIRNALYGVNISSSTACEESLPCHASGIKPPGYMIKMVLVFLYGGLLPQGKDKSEWELYIKYQDYVFLITDYKRYKWNIYGTEGSQTALIALKKKIISAANILNKQIGIEAKANINSDKFFVQNQYHKTLALYEYFSSTVKSLLDKSAYGISEEGSKKYNDSLGDINFEIQHNYQIEFNLIATTVFFFALTGVIFDACFAFGDRKGFLYEEFRKKEWAERLKFFFDLSSDSTLTADYEDVVEARRYYRNIPIHASPEYFFPLEGFGLIPSNYATLGKPHISPYFAFDKNEAVRLSELFNRILEYFETHRLPRCAKIYLESGLQIPIDKKEAEELKGFMSSDQTLREELRKRSEFQDMLDNMYL